MTDLPNRPYLKIKEVADYFNVSSKTIERWVKKGDLLIIKIGGTIRVNKQSVYNFESKSIMTSIKDEKEIFQKRIIQNMRSRISSIYRGKVKDKTTLKILGCSLEKFYEYIENQFRPGMSFQNYGVKGWHIDHIIPCSRFDLTKPGHIEKCFHYTNLQPMWAIDNIRKSNKITRRTIGEYLSNIRVA